MSGMSGGVFSSNIMYLAILGGIWLLGLGAIISFWMISNTAAAKDTRVLRVLLRVVAILLVPVLLLASVALLRKQKSQAAAESDPDRNSYAGMKFDFSDDGYYGIIVGPDGSVIVNGGQIGGGIDNEDEMITDDGSDDEDGTETGGTQEESTPPPQNTTEPPQNDPEPPKDDTQTGGDAAVDIGALMGVWVSASRQGDTIIASYWTFDSDGTYAWSESEYVQVYRYESMGFTEADGKDGWMPAPQGAPYVWGTFVLSHPTSGILTAFGYDFLEDYSFTETYSFSAQGDILTLNGNTYYRTNGGDIWAAVKAMGIDISIDRG